MPTESLIPKELEGIASGSDFVDRLPEFDDHFERMRSEAAKEGKVLRFVGLIDVKQGQLKAGLERWVASRLLTTCS